MTVKNVFSPAELVLLSLLLLLLKKKACLLVSPLPIKTKLAWGEEQERALVDLKETPCNESLILSFNFHLPLSIQTDACGRRKAFLRGALSILLHYFVLNYMLLYTMFMLLYIALILKTSVQC